jgi:hypothetical protein
MPSRMRTAVPASPARAVTTSSRTSDASSATDSG